MKKNIPKKLDFYISTISNDKILEIAYVLFIFWLIAPVAMLFARGVDSAFAVMVFINNGGHLSFINPFRPSLTPLFVILVYSRYVLIGLLAVLLLEILLALKAILATTVKNTNDQ